MSTQLRSTPQHETISWILRPPFPTEQILLVDEARAAEMR